MELSELTLENLGVWPLPAKAAVAAFACAIILALGYWFALRPQIKTYSQAKIAESDLRAKFELKSGQTANLQIYKNQVIEVKKMLNTMLYQLPEKTEIPNLLEDISKVGVASGLEFKLIKPEAEQKHEFYVELPIEISVMGNYHQMAAFISSLANLQRIVAVENFSIEKTQQPQSTNQSNQAEPLKPLPPLTMTMLAKTFHYLGENTPSGSATVTPVTGLPVQPSITPVSEPNK